MSTISEIKEKLKDLTLELNSVCYNSNLIPQLQTVWDKLNLLEESIEKFDSWKDAKMENKNLKRVYYPVSDTYGWYDPDTDTYYDDNYEEEPYQENYKDEDD